ncbi:MAG: SdiA-regulated domain-containing protein, partial [Verrucomicrobiota bacterium]
RTPGSYVLEDWTTPEQKARRIKTHLSSKHDTEGLAFDEAGNRLLVLCKEAPEKKSQHLRAVYAFDLASEELSREPVFNIDWHQLPARRDPGDFKPAALAIHPVNREIYTISSKEKLLVVLSPSGEFLHAETLPGKRFPQAEGLAFLPNGDLFIANEGKKSPATLLRFSV